MVAGVLVSVGIYLSLPPIVTISGGDEINLALTRAEAVNMAKAVFAQSSGREDAKGRWGATASPQERYELLLPFLAFAPNNFEDYMPKGYRLVLPEELDLLAKVPLVKGQEIVY